MSLDVLHNFEILRNEVKFNSEMEKEDMTSILIKKGMPVPKPAKSNQPIYRNLYDMIDGELPKKISPQTQKLKKIAPKKVEKSKILSAFKMAFTTFFRQN